jgi:hypothetical protein
MGHAQTRSPSHTAAEGHPAPPSAAPWPGNTRTGRKKAASLHAHAFTHLRSTWGTESRSCCHQSHPGTCSPSSHRLRHGSGKGWCRDSEHTQQGHKRSGGGDITSGTSGCTIQEGATQTTGEGGWVAAITTRHPNMPLQAHSLPRPLHTTLHPGPVRHSLHADAKSRTSAERERDGVQPSTGQQHTRSMKGVGKRRQRGRRKPAPCALHIPLRHHRCPTAQVGEGSSTQRWGTHSCSWGQ